MAFDEKSLLFKRKNIALSELEKARLALEEEQRAAGVQQEAATGIQGGFATDRGIVLDKEAKQAAADIETEFQTELDVLEEIEAQRKKAEDEAKKKGVMRNVLQLGGMALGAALAIPTGGLSLAAGASLGGTAGSLAGGLLGYNDLQAGDVGRLMQGIGQAQEQMKAADYMDLLRKQKLDQWGQNVQLAPTEPMGFLQ